MPVHFKTVLHHGNPDDGTVLSGELSEQKWELLTRFRDEVARLRSCRWVKDGVPSRFKINVNPADGMKLEMPGKPDETAVVEVLHCLRPFVLENEDTHFLKAVKALQSGVRDKRFKASLKPYRDRFTGDDQKDLVRLYELGVDSSLIDPAQPFEDMLKEYSDKHLQLNTEKALKLWLNAFEYHRDEDKRKEFETRTGGEPDELALAVFRSLIAGKVEAVIKFANLLESVAKAPSTIVTGA